MGSRSKYICTNADCEYEATVSGGKSQGMHSFTQTYVCRDCEILEDICIGKRIEDTPARELKELEKSLIPMPQQSNFEKFKSLFREDLDFKKRMEVYYQLRHLPLEDYIHFYPKEDLCCYECKGKNIEIWDEELASNEKHCPKCFNTMKVTFPGFIMWD
jgi:hypothetical protein